MRRIRIIPVLQILNRKLVKTTAFNSPAYVGDPINALKIFNEKEVDEIAVVDIGASQYGSKPDIEYIKILSGECFMPLSYGGGITSLQDAREIFQCGVEKIILGSAACKNPDCLMEITKHFGSQSVVVSIDVKKDLFGRWRVYIESGKVKTRYDPMEYASMVVKNGAGELLLQTIDREGSKRGYELSILERIAQTVGVPVVPLGGASSLNDFLEAVKKGASAVAAGDMFVYKGPHKAVLINYPSQKELIKELYTAL